MISLCLARKLFGFSCPCALCSMLYAATLQAMHMELSRNTRYIRVQKFPVSLCVWYVARNTDFSFTYC